MEYYDKHIQFKQMRIEVWKLFFTRVGPILKFSRGHDSVYLVYQKNTKVKERMIFLRINRIFASTGEKEQSTRNYVFNAIIVK